MNMYFSLKKLELESICLKYKETKKHELTNSYHSPNRDHIFIYVKEPDSPGNIKIKISNDTKMVERICHCV